MQNNYQLFHNCKSQQVENSNFKFQQKNLKKYAYHQFLQKQSLQTLGESWEITQQDIPQTEEEQKQNQNPIDSNSEEEYFGQQQQDNCIFMMNFNQNSTKFAFSSENSIVNIWDIQNRKNITQLKDHTEIVIDLQWFKTYNNYEESQKMVTCSLDKTIKIWDNYQCIQTLNGHSDWLRSISLSNQNDYLVSGCVSSSVVTWDLNSMKKLFTVNHDQGVDFLNTINILDFKKHDKNVFLCGTRDGYLRLYDIRSESKILEFKSHDNKLNSAYFSQNDSKILSAGRDSSIRLWDIRFIKPNIETNYKLDKIQGYQSQYQKHKCQGYNIQANFINYEKNIITGSEDYSILIYNTNTGQVDNLIETNNKVNHLVKPSNNPQDIIFAQSGLQENSIHFYEPLYNQVIQKEKEKYKNPAFNVEQEEQNPFFDESEILEEAMTEYGDQILKIFHKNGFKYSKQLDWQNLIQLVSQADDQEGKEVIEKFQNLIYKKINESMIQVITGQKKKKPDLSVNQQLILQKQNNINKECNKCQNLKNKLQNNILSQKFKTEQLQIKEQQETINLIQQI